MYLEWNEKYWVADAERGSKEIVLHSLVMAADFITL